VIVSDVSWDRLPILLDIVIEEEYILLELAEDHERPILREIGTRHRILIVVDRVTCVISG
jgi:hypothetical protein